MKTYKYIITLVSDGEPGTGLGTETINSIIPRDAQGKPYIPASHLKGIMRENFVDIISSFLDEKKAKTLSDAVFGRPGSKGDDGVSGSFYISEAKIKEDTKVNQVARTALNDFGTAKDTSLRISENIAINTVFEGNLVIEGDEWQDIAARLALLSVSAIGANRNRGAGACFIKIDSLKETPGQLLTELSKKTTPEFFVKLGSGKRSIDSNSKKLSDKTVFAKLSFKASSPICCPELPVIGTNAIKSGFAIPASAVQGAVLTKIDSVDHALASALFEAPNFRVSPLLPTDEGFELSTYVSQTHKITKDGSTFFELFLNKEPWEKQNNASPLKGTDGVLLQARNGSVQLWRSADMPRVINAHCVVNGQGEDARGKAVQERNLFSVEALAVTDFCGIIALPEDALTTLKEVFAKDPYVALGKTRTVRGGGKLTVINWAISDLPPIAQKFEAWQNKVFIVQSPVAIPEELRNTHESAEAILQKIVEKSGWGKVEKTSASITVKFGWNRHTNGGRQSATPVIVPGSVFKLETPVSAERLEELLIRGVGEMRERGYGFVLPHPGEASLKFNKPPQRLELTSTSNSSTKGYELWKQANGNLSASQIAALAVERSVSKERALKYLERQIFERPKTIADKWKTVVTTSNGNITDGLVFHAINSDYALEIFEVWRNLTVADTKEERRNIK